MSVDKQFDVHSVQLQMISAGGMIVAVDGAGTHYGIFEPWQYAHALRREKTTELQVHSFAWVIVGLA